MPNQPPSHAWRVLWAVLLALAGCEGPRTPVCYVLAVHASVHCEPSPVQP